MIKTLQTNKQRGFTIIELLVAMVAALLISLAVINVIAAHTTALYTQARSNQAAEDGMESYALISRLLRQAQASNITVTRDAGNSLTLDLATPVGFQVWPNVVEPYTDNWVRLAWSSTGDNASQITVANAATEAALADATATALAGVSTGDNTGVALFDVEDLLDGSYRLIVATNAGSFDNGATTFEGIVMPRNRE